MEIKCSDGNKKRKVCHRSIAVAKDEDNMTEDVVIGSEYCESAKVKAGVLRW